MTDLFAALLLGIIEGITEFLPISSTGHLLIAEHWLGHRSDLFNIAIQAGAILAVVLIYWQRLWTLLVGFAQKNNRDYALKLMLAFAVTGALGIVVKKLGFELPETIAPIAWALLVGGLVILGIEAIDARRPDLPDDDPNAIGWGTAVLVGLAQVLAGVFPGTSRSAAAIFAALLFGKSSRLAATEFAFLVGIPTMFAATGYELLDMVRDGSVANEDWTALTVAFVASAITAFVAVKWLLHYIQTHRFTIFAWYRIAFGALLLAWLYFGGAAPVPAMHAATGKTVQAAQMVTAPRPSLGRASIEHAARQPAPADAEAASAALAAQAPALDPVAAAASREFRVRAFCTSMMYARANMESPDMQAFLAAMVSDKRVSPQMRAEGLANLQSGLDDLEDAERACAGMVEKLMDGSSYQVALRAAELGDSQAAQCFLSGHFPMPPRMHENPESLQRWRLDAARLIDQGIARGDWDMVNAAANAYSPMPGKPAPRFEAPYYEGGLRLTWSIGGPAGNVEMAYRAMRLMELGASSPEAASSYRENANEYARRLSPEKMNAADAWARQAYNGQFRRRKMVEENTTFCEEG